MSVLLESRSFRPFKSSEEYLWAMKEDLAEWLNGLYPDIYINVNNFLDRLDTGVALCKHANNVRKYAEEYVTRRQKYSKSGAAIAASVLNLSPIRSFPGAKAGTFFARDNVSNFISWCRQGLGVFECLLFETDDLIMRKNEKHVILCLLEVARRGAKLGMPAPMLVQLEREIDREIAAEKRDLKRGLSMSGCTAATQGFDLEDEDDESDLSDVEDCSRYGPLPQIVTNDLKSLDEMVRDLVEKCRCPTQFPMIRVSEGKYRIGDTKVLIFVRVLRSHVMVRVGGGWDTLSHYLDKHDPCRCKTAHRAPVSAKIVGLKTGIPKMDIAGTQVHYERSPPRTRRSSTSSVGSNSGGLTASTPLSVTRNRSRSPSQLQPSAARHSNLSPAPTRRSRSPTPRRTLTPTPNTRNRSRSPTPRAGSRNRSVSPAPRREPSRSPTPCREHSSTRSSAPRARHSRSDSPKCGENVAEPSLESSHLASHPSSSSLVDVSSIEVQSSQLSNDKDLENPDCQTPGVLFSNNVNAQALIPSNRAVASLITENVLTAAIENKGSEMLDKLVTENACNSKTKTEDQSAGVDCTPCSRVSDNFIKHPVRSSSICYGSMESPRVREYESGVDTSPAQKVSDNFTSQHRVSVSMVRSPTPVKEDKCGVNCAPLQRISDNFAGGSDSTVSRRRSSKYASANGLDTLGSTDAQTNNDSGSEVSDEGYRSLGLANTNAATNTPVTKSLTASPVRGARPTRSRSVSSSQESNSQPPAFQRNGPAHRSVRVSSARPSAATATATTGTTQHNTWNSGGRTKKSRPALSQDTFCQQISEIMQQYAAMMPSPRKDSKPDSGVITRIPAPVQRT